MRGLYQRVTNSRMNTGRRMQTIPEYEFAKVSSKVFCRGRAITVEGPNAVVKILSAIEAAFLDIRSREERSRPLNLESRVEIEYLDLRRRIADLNFP